MSAYGTVLAILQCKRCCTEANVFDYYLSLFNNKCLLTPGVTMSTIPRQDFLSGRGGGGINFLIAVIVLQILFECCQYCLACHRIIFFIKLIFCLWPDWPVVN